MGIETLLKRAREVSIGNRLTSFEYFEAFVVRWGGESRKLLCEESEAVAIWTVATRGQERKSCSLPTLYRYLNGALINTSNRPSRHHYFNPLNHKNNNSQNSKKRDPSRLPHAWGVTGIRHNTRQRCRPVPSSPRPRPHHRSSSSQRPIPKPTTTSGTKPCNRTPLQRRLRRPNRELYSRVRLLNR